MQHDFVEAIIREKDKVFLIQRVSKKFPDYWAGPGGKLNPKEKSEKAVKREVKEEIGADFQIAKTLGFCGFFKKDEKSVKNQEIHAGFEGNIQGNIKLNKKEAKAYKWFTYEQAQNLKLMPSTTYFLKISYEKPKVPVFPFKVRKPEEMQKLKGLQKKEEITSKTNIKEPKTRITKGF
ncbi:MAG: NUDIX hydrolase [Nanoarchaeota archaeon]|nr:NUDIX hydrolase [Nanoarchaeota archaeon]